MRDALLLLAALAASIAGMGWFALGMDGHWRQVQGNMQRSPRTIRRLRLQGAAALTASLAPCLAQGATSIASLVWIMLLTTAAVIVAFTLTWRAHWLRVLTPRYATMNPGRVAKAEERP